MELVQFLIKAKNGAYASGAGGESILEDGCKELTYQAHDFQYRDRYFGFNPFVGEEVVWQAGELVWAMNYYGLVLSEVVPANEIYTFLQKAMRQVSEERPFRGPRSLKEADFEYQDESQGSLVLFTGTERIYYRHQEVYRLNYHGGVVNNKPG
jgi:hypothetical protein